MTLSVLEKLNVWTEALAYTKEVFDYTLSLKRVTTPFYIDELRKASLEVPLYVAQGKGAYSSHEFSERLSRAREALYKTITIIKTCELIEGTSPPNLTLLSEQSTKLAARISALLYAVNQRSTRNQSQPPSGGGVAIARHKKEKGAS
ncbi:MAG: four helix bundle protein [Candidatus Omnitrophica bacterium]|nr:four helix bundle protein [Candidatus Omnitrophota bacterium]